MSQITGRVAFLFVLAFLSREVIAGPQALADDTPKAYRSRAAYFPKATLLTQEGKEVLFYDLIKGKIVVINCMYTRCDGKLCGEGTKNLVKLQKALGNRLGREVFMYSITLDPEHDTPEVLKDYAKEYRARWTFLTAKGEDNKKKVEDITKLRHTLGLYNSKPKEDADLKKHMGMITIGNANLDKWDKTSILSSPDKILQMIERLKPPTPPEE
jgi:protein SCO1/2